MKNLLSFFISLSLIFGCDKKGTIAQTQSPAISTLNCSAATSVNTATAGIAYSGIITIPYTGGNGTSYSNGNPVISIGVSGLSATLQGGTLASGSGNFSYSISGTPSGTGTAVFDISYGGQTCIIKIAVNEAALTQYGTPFANVVDRQDATIYQVNTRVFSASRNFQGVISRLDSIKALSANVIYLMPIHPVGTVNSVNSPYSVKDYKAINPDFGTLADLRALVDGAHARNMSVIMDWVANHTAWDNLWTTTHSDWYLKNSSGAIVSPPGMGWNDVAQLNFNNAAMRLEMIKNMKYWVYTANIDGFRFDYADGPPVDFWKQAIDTLRNITSHKLLLLAEGNRSNHFTQGFDFTFGFSFFGQLKTIFSGGNSVVNIDVLNNTEYANAADGQQVVRYLTNHDVNGSDGTPQELFGGQAGSMAAFVVVAYMKSVPMIYNGQEVGTPGKIPFPFTGPVIDWTINPAITAEYKRIIAFRNSSAAIRRGTLVSFSTSDVSAFTKELGAEKVFVISNLRNSTINFSIPASLVGTTWTNAMTGTSLTLSTSLSLTPYSYLVLKN